jgi:hypothetical protein
VEEPNRRDGETLKLAGSIPASCAFAFLRQLFIFGFDPKAKNLL